MQKLPYLALLVCLGCVPASGTSEPASPAASGGEVASADGKQAEPEMECKRERPTGSSISRKVCRPKADSTADQQAVERLQRGSNTITQGR